LLRGVSEVSANPMTTETKDNGNQPRITRITRIPIYLLSTQPPLYIRVIRVIRG